MTGPVSGAAGGRAEGLTGPQPPHCETCQCGRWAPVQVRSKDVPRGSGAFVISWAEHLEAWKGYAADGHGDQDADAIARRAGFSLGELRRYLGREPETLRPRRAS